MQYEYKVIDTSDGTKWTREFTSDFLNRAGSTGWRMTHCETDLLYLERPVDVGQASRDALRETHRTLKADALLKEMRQHGPLGFGWWQRRNVDPDLFDKAKESFDYLAGLLGEEFSPCTCKSAKYGGDCEYDEQGKKICINCKKLRSLDECIARLSERATATRDADTEDPGVQGEVNQDTPEDYVKSRGLNLDSLTKAPPLNPDGPGFGLQVPDED